MISIKSEREIDLMRTSGKILVEVLESLSKKCTVGTTTKEIDDLAYKLITSKGCSPSFLGFEGFPASICVSINDEVVHGIPSKRKLENGDIVSIDIGINYKGYNTDSAYTFIVGNTDSKTKKFVDETKRSLYEGIKQVKAGVSLNEVCSAIEAVAKENNYGVIRELAGHGVGTYLHEDPVIPNYSNSSSKKVILKEGMTLAIEPMFALGDRNVWLLDNKWTISTKDKSNVAHFEHTILVTKDGYEILTGE